MNLSIRPVYRRIFAVFILLILSFVFWAIVVRPSFTTIIERNNDIEETRFQLGKFNGLAAKKVSAEEALVKVTASQSNRGEFLQEGTSALASAQLQTRLQAIVKSNGAEISATRTLPPQDYDGFQKIGLRITLAGELDAVKTILHKIESNVPYLLVDNLELKPSRVQGSANQLRLDATLDVLGFLPEGG